MGKIELDVLYGLVKGYGAGRWYTHWCESCTVNIWVKSKGDNGLNCWSEWPEQVLSYKRKVHKATSERVFRKEEIESDGEDEESDRKIACGDTDENWWIWRRSCDCVAMISIFFQCKLLKFAIQEFSLPSSIWQVRSLSRRGNRWYEFIHFGGTEPGRNRYIALISFVPKIVLLPVEDIVTPVWSWAVLRKILEVLSVLIL